MVHAAVRAGRMAGATVPGRLWQRRLDLATTPGRLRLLLGGLVLLSLAWGGLAAFSVSQYAAAASSVVNVREPLSLDAQQIYSRLSDANDAAATAFLTGGLEPAATRQRYLADIAAASSAIENVTAQGGAGSGAAAQDLSTLARDLPVYSGEIETARADNRLGLPLGAAYLREASALMRGTPQVRGCLDMPRTCTPPRTRASAVPAPRRPGCRLSASPRRRGSSWAARCTGEPGGCAAAPTGCSTWACSPPARSWCCPSDGLPSRSPACAATCLTPRPAGSPRSRRPHRSASRRRRRTPTRASP